MGVKKPRRKADGSYELPIECIVCGSSKMEINSVSRAYHCWVCNASGVAGNNSRYGTFFLSTQESVSNASLSSMYGTEARSGGVTNLTTIPSDLTDKFPLFAEQECVRRRQEEQWLIRRYNVRWSNAHQRLWFPTRYGGVLRSVLPWEEPKTYTVVPAYTAKGLIGEHLLTRESTGREIPTSRKAEQYPSLTHQGIPVLSPLDLVITEGDWKAVSIPVPWVGLGLMGTNMSRNQRDSILLANPTSVTIILDGGCEREAQRIVEYFLPYRAVRINLPGSLGPDDIPRQELVKLLLERRV